MPEIKKKNKGGRPTDYQPSFAKQAFNYALLGATDEEMATFFDVSIQTLNTWKKAQPKFLESIKKGKAAADANVAGKLYTRALGYTFEEVTFEKIGTREDLEQLDSKKIMIDAYRKKVTVKEVIPDTTAQIFWLKNRQKGKWRDKHDLSIDFDKLTDEQLDFLINKITHGELKS